LTDLRDAVKARLFREYNPVLQGVLAEIEGRLAAPVVSAEKLALAEVSLAAVASRDAEASKRVREAHGAAKTAHVERRFFVQLLRMAKQQAIDLPALQSLLGKALGVDAARIERELTVVKSEWESAERVLAALLAGPQERSTPGAASEPADPIAAALQALTANDAARAEAQLRAAYLQASRSEDVRSFYVRLLTFCDRARADFAVVETTLSAALPALDRDQRLTELKQAKTEWDAAKSVMSKLQAG
jgi:hypothetical protein